VNRTSYEARITQSSPAILGSDILLKRPVLKHFQSIFFP